MTIDRTGNDNDALDDEKFNTGSDKVYQNYMMPGLELFDAKVTINHWQLRDCVKHSTSKPGKIYYVYDHSIRELNMNPRYMKHLGNSSLIKKKLRRNSTNTTTKDKKYLSSNRLISEFNTPSNCVVDFNFKPRCFTESNGLIACGGLIGPDDKGFPTNWSRLSHEVNNGVQLPPPASPIKLSNSSVLQDHSNYSNQNLWKGILSIHNTETGVSQSLIMGQFINNCVTMHSKGNQEVDLYSCNNDNHMYQCNISNRGVELVRRYSDLKFALNNVALSNDASLMVISGDSNKFALYRKNEIDGQFSLSYDTQPQWGNSTARVERIPRFALPDNTSAVDHIYEAPNSDHGFYSSFSENDLQFATLFQNGVCLLYDVRKMSSPLAEINSTRPYSHSGAFRVCKFSYGLDDLLFISEHQGRVHVIDTRNFTNHQVIMIPDKFKEDNIRKHNIDTDISTDIRRNTANISSVTGITSPLSTPSSSALSFASSLRRRYSFPTPTPVDNTDNCITSARSVPLKYLEPRIMPYPKIANRSTNEYNNTQYRGLLLWDDSEGNNRRRERRSSFRVRRVSTSSNTSNFSENNENVDPEILNPVEDEQENSNNEPYSTRDINATIESQIGRNSNNNIFIEDDIYGIDSSLYIVRNGLQSPSPFARRPGNSYLNSQSNNSSRETIIEYSSIEFMEENNISGLDWLEDVEGSSLVIGTDYGIMKWNINSWARRSFASYDFC
ncbi:hypothetical protein Kpol_1036p93 [Vanderwaltozyma polyspora DSM 70294]|uniref:DUF2415 domain-containing protein n=1 Tax=Vanderwaltozyma polyspora (strain ATCC 22028 / DSM 70294 / BCRC 21397 / CBS 2163 / NBRC 10782 / NRRL Y-8283 / UCD 57-17) TaxID=436907 RepID=A7TEN9_VANPO|nr:uncharacterized protein Kpol_1036p93 [Vanderwaltozyma polyspora DSM 70294]EDO19346.1 hypothetical protein Kpol_1036p93 [Vanderwaltozyma polyspora DSM 70294]